MEIKTGYRKTEIGVIPNEWQLVKVNDIIDLLTDYDANGSFASVAENVKVYDNVEYAWYVRSTDLEKNSLLSDVKYIDEPSYKFLKKTKLIGGELLFLKRGDIGKVYLFKMRTQFATVAPNLYLLKINHKTMPKYLYYFFNTICGQQQLKSKNASSTLGALYKDDVKSIIVPLPSLPEQKAIAEVLTDTDNLIQAIEKQIVKKLLIKQGLIQKFLTPKKGWTVKRFEELSDPNKKWSFTGGPFGSNLKSSDYTDEGVRIIQLQNIGDGEFINDYEINTSKKKADELISCNIYPDEIILSKMGDPVARACIVPCIHNRYLMCSDGIRLAINKKEYSTYFIYLLINSPFFRSKAENASTGSTRKRIGLNELRNIELMIPKLEEQESIASIIMAMDSEIVSLKKKISKYKSLKQGLMENLFTGNLKLVKS
jgi:type I restriction enzyme S subunit